VARTSTKTRSSPTSSTTGGRANRVRPPFQAL
jgi:hypothetical protein